MPPAGFAHLGQVLGRRDVGPGTKTRVVKRLKERGPAYGGGTMCEQGGRSEVPRLASRLVGRAFADPRPNQLRLEPNQ